MERYEKIRVIGQGAFGKVFLCRSNVDRSLLVIKQIPVDELPQQERLASMNEVDVLKRLKHPNIIAHFNNFVEDKSLMIVMEYAPGGTLFDFIQERNGHLLQEEHILKFFVQLLVAIEHVHSLNILHRDLKTQNIFMNKRRTVLKVGDFGISKVLSSKITSAQTIVGTPCYISPEICEGRLYAKKSDLWALGCILYELTTLKKAFEGPNLPALVLKIMQASAVLVPIDSRYSRGLWELIRCLLRRNADDRPTIQSVMAMPTVINALLNICTDIGRLPCSRATPEEEALPNGSTLLSGPSQTGVHALKPQAYLWGGGAAVPTVLPGISDSQLVGVAVGRTQRAALTEEGKLVFWELSSGSLGTMRFTMQPSAAQGRRREPLIFIPRLVGGLSTAVIRKVACGDMFTACLTDSGILMTFGSGMSGCLGHGDNNDASEPRMVQKMLGYETLEVACGSNHVLAITSESTVFSWGNGESGQLGLGTMDSHPSPQPVFLPEGHTPRQVCCGPDCSLLITDHGQLLATGSNRYNKLALDNQQASKEETAVKNEAELLHPPLTGDRETDRESTDKEGDAPVILSLIKDPPNLMSSSLILSSFHARKMARNGTGDQQQAQEQHGSAAFQSRTTRVQQRGGSGVVDEVCVFKPNGSPLLNSKRITAASTGTNHTVFITEDGVCLVCGDNSYGQLGVEREKGDRSVSTVTAFQEHTVVRVACGDFFTVATTTGGKVYSWGRGRMGRLGREGEEDTPTPQLVPFEGPQSIRSLACSHGITLLLTTTHS